MSRAHIDPLTGIRGFASLWVLLHHAPNLFPIGEFNLGVFEPFFEKGWLGVDLFFVLSGFVISYVYADKMRTFSWSDARQFWSLRIARVYPAHVVATLAFVPVVVLAQWKFGYSSPNDAFSLPKLAYALTLTNGWGFPDSAGWNLPSWSVSSEWFAYLLFPFLTLPLARKRPAPFAGPAVDVAAIALILAGCSALGFALNDNNSFTLAWGWALLRITSEFVIGCLLFNVFRHCRTQPLFDGLAAGAGLGIIAVSFAGLPPAFDVVLIALFAVLVLALARAEGPTAKLLGSGPMVYLGEISYSIYLAHALIILLMGQLAQRVWTPESVPTWAFGATLVAYLGASMVAGHLLHHFIEQPARRWLRRRWTP